MKETVIKVKGMVCGGCENRVKNALEAVNGIESVEANHETGLVKVIAKEDIERKTMEDTINDIGFEVVEEN